MSVDGMLNLIILIVVAGHALTLSWLALKTMAVLT